MGGSAAATDLEKLPIEQVLANLGVRPDRGLLATEAQQRLARYGPNALIETEKGLAARILGHFTGPIAYMIEAAAIVSAVLGRWEDFAIITTLLLFNAALEFWQDLKSSNALAALKKGLALILVAFKVHHDIVVADTWGVADALNILQFVLILLIASIPVAMPAVFSITMALGALALSKEKAIVSKLAAIEEMAGVDVLCSDKTGTLTKNQLSLSDPILFAGRDPQDCVLAAALASKIEDRDAIDTAVIAALKGPEGARALEADQVRALRSGDQTQAIALTQMVAIAMCGLGWLVEPIGWKLIAWVWAYDLAWLFVLGGVRLITERFAEYRTARHSKSVGLVSQTLQPHVPGIGGSGASRV